ncbi:MAG TPA: tetratricopeptide repeat protein [Kofleriaceae bacterium]|jgi:tetratricopeptide (TPR) repeat protein|nr:tetratricopeptide repeat protein [Kofleriaceae bacterium]
MIELYSIRDVSRILAVQESRLRYWTQTGFVGPTVRKGGRFYYTFPDLVAVKGAKDLLATGMPLQRARKNVEALRRALPGDTHPTSRLRVCCDGETVVALADDVAFQPISGQIVMAFSLPSFGEHVTATLAMPRAAAPEPTAVPAAVQDGPTEANGGSTAYRHFVEACAAEDRGDSDTAEHLFRLAIELEPRMAAALTNLGNLLYRQGELHEARRLYERALEHDPAQPEARYNLANLLEDLGETDLAIAELRRVCAAAPEFADAHYNLGIMLAQVGGTTQARQCLERYLELDATSDWAHHARSYLDQIAV